MYAEQMEELIALAQRLSETKPADEALFTWLRAETKTTITFRAIKLYLMSGNPEGRTVTFGWKERLMEALGLLLRNAQAKGVVRKGIDAGSVLRLVHGVVTAAETAADSSGRQVSQLLDIVIDGLRAHAE